MQENKKSYNWLSEKNLSKIIIFDDTNYNLLDQILKLIGVIKNGKNDVIFNKLWLAENLMNTRHEKNVFNLVKNDNFI